MNPLNNSDTTQYVVYHPTFGFITTNYENIVTSNLDNPSKYWNASYNKHTFIGTISKVSKLFLTAENVVFGRYPIYSEKGRFFSSLVLDSYFVALSDETEAPDFSRAVPIVEVIGEQLRFVSLPEGLVVK